MTTHDELVEFEGWIREGLERAAPQSTTKHLVTSEDRGSGSLRSHLAQLGVLGAFVPAACGGLEVSPLMLQALLRASGSQLVPTGILSGSVIAPYILGFSEAETDALGAIANGSKQFTWADDDSQSDPVKVINGKLTGTKIRVLDADIVDEFIVTATAGDTINFYLVDKQYAVVDEREPLDQTRPALTVNFHEAPTRQIRVINPEHVAAQARLLVVLGLAAEAAGEARASLEKTVSYALLREQFGRQVGSFQAVKHLCADMFVAAEGAEAGVEMAARSWEEKGELDTFEVMATAVFAFDAARSNASSMMQIHGGIAFTWEADPHWYLKRATATPLIAPSVNYDSVAEMALAENFSIVDALFSQRGHSQ